MNLKETTLAEYGRRVIATEYRALQKLEESIGESFEQAIQLILNTFKDSSSGRLIISGMGKSGHIGKKIAATLASTGQPSYFVHPAESGHGDLGMITKGDVLLLMSTSGESKELTAVIDYAKRFSIPIIAITSRANSTLAKCADIPLILPHAPEACPMGIAPTTSSTMTLALGDAIAITLLTSRGFTNSDFHIFHPSGSLGQQLKRVENIMFKEGSLPLATAGILMRDAIEVMTKFTFGAVGIVNASGQLLGIITDGDLRRHMRANLLDQTVEQVMTVNPLSLSRDDLVADAIALFEKKSIACAFVCEEGRPIGFIRLLDCLRAYAPITI